MAANHGKSITVVQKPDQNKNGYSKTGNEKGWNSNGSGIQMFGFWIVTVLNNVSLCILPFAQDWMCP
jgi:hypothetical protein